MSNAGDPVEELKRALLKAAGDRNRRMAAGIPHLKAALLEMREAAALGASGESFRKAQRNLAAYLEECESDMVRT